MAMEGKAQRFRGGKRQRLRDIRTEARVPSNHSRWHSNNLTLARFFLASTVAPLSHYGVSGRWRRILGQLGPCPQKWRGSIPVLISRRSKQGMRTVAAGESHSGRWKPKDLDSITDPRKAIEYMAPFLR